MKSEEIKKLKKLHKRFEKLQIQAASALGALSYEFSQVTDKSIICEYLTGDGVGVQIEDNPSNSYMSFQSAIDLIAEKGTIDETDRTYF